MTQQAPPRKTGSGGPPGCARPGPYEQTRGRVLPGTYALANRRPTPTTGYTNGFLGATRPVYPPPSEAPLAPANNEPGLGSPSPSTPGSTHSTSGGTILKEGYLNRKTDLHPNNPVSSALLARGWKVYRVMLKGSKLYFYKPPSEGEVRKRFPFEGSPLSTATQSLSAPDAHPADDPEAEPVHRGLPLLAADFDPSAVPFLFEADVRAGAITAPLCTRYVFGGHFTEVDIVKFKFKRYVCLLVFDDLVVVCKRKWVKQHKGVAGAVTGAFRLARSLSTRLKETSDAASLRSVDGGRGAGYYTRWKQHACYPLTSVDVVEAASTRLSVSAASRTTLYAQANVSSTSVMTTASTVSTDYASVVGAGNVQAFQMFVARGKDSVTRLFVAGSASDKAVWVARFMAAKAAYGRRQRPRVEPDARSLASSGRASVSVPLSTHVTSAAAPTTKGGARPTRRRLYWSTDRHPELILRADDTESASSPPVTAGTRTALVHELLFHTPDGPAHATVDFDTYLMVFLVTYPCFMTARELVQELERYAELITATAAGAPFARNFGQLLARWIAWAPTDVRDGDLADTLIKLVAKLVVPHNATLAAKLRDEIAAAATAVEKPPKGAADVATGRPSMIRFADGAGVKGKPDPGPPAQRPRVPRVPSGSETPLVAQVLANGLSPTLFLKLTPQDLALQLYLYHWHLYFARDPLAVRQFLAGEGIESAVSIGSRALHFTPDRPHFLTRLLIHHVLADLPPTRHAKRSTLLAHWIKVGESARRMNDAVAWAAVAIGLTHPAVARLYEAWREVPLPWRQVVADQWVPLLVEHGLVASATLAPPARPRVVAFVPTAASSRGFHPTTLPAIPYCGTVVHALTLLDAAGPVEVELSTVRPNHPAGRDTEARYVDVRKYWRLYEVVWRAIRDSPVTRPTAPLASPPVSSVAASAAKATATVAGAASALVRSASRGRLSKLANSSSSGAAGSNGTSSSGAASEPLTPPLAALAAALPTPFDRVLLTPQPGLQRYFDRLDSASPTSDDDPHHLFRLSLAIEPALATAVPRPTEPASLESVVCPLAFPEVVVSSRLTHLLAIQGRLDLIGFRAADGFARPRSSIAHVHSLLADGNLDPTDAMHSPLALGPTSITQTTSASVGSAAAAAAAAAIRPLTGFGLSSVFGSSSGAGGSGGDSGFGLRNAGKPSSHGRSMSTVNEHAAPPERRSPNNPGRIVKLKGAASGEISAPLAGEPDSPNLKASQSAPRLKNKRSMSFPAPVALPMEGSPSAPPAAELESASASPPSAARTRVFHAADLPAGVLLTIPTADLIFRLQHFKAKTVRRRDGRTAAREELMVSVHGGTLSRLIDVLVHGVRQYQPVLATVANRDQAVLLRGELLLDYPQYQAAFLATYRALADGATLLTHLRQCYDDSPVYARRLVAVAREGTAAAAGDARPTTSVTRNEEIVAGDVRRRVVNLCDYWLRCYLSDFLDAPALRDAMVDFLQMAAADPCITAPSDVVPPARLLETLLRGSLQPGRPDLLTTPDGAVMPLPSPLALAAGTVPARIPKLKLAAHSPAAILVALDAHAASLFAACRPRDWVATFGLFEAQTAEDLAWYPARRSPVPDEDVVVADLLTALETVKCVRPTDPQGRDLPDQPVPDLTLARALPSAIQHLLFLHRNLRQWVIAHLADPDMELDGRVHTLLTWLEVLRLSGQAGSRAPIHAVRDTLHTTLNTNVAPPARQHVPGFVEAAVAAALISPEVRAFTRTWSEVAHLTGCAVDTLEPLLRHDRSFLALHSEPSSPSTPLSAVPNDAPRLVPSLAWLLQNAVELCYDAADFLVDDDRLIYFEKRRRTRALLAVCERLSLPLAASPPPPTIPLPYLTTFADLPPVPLRRVQETAHAENTHTYGSAGYTGGIHVKMARPFARLVTEEQDRLRRVTKEHDRLTRELRDLAETRRRREAERDRQLKKQLRESQQRRARNEQLLKVSSLMRSVTTSGGSGTPRELKRMPSVKAALVVNLINSTTDVAHAYTKRDHVFRVVTEEGGQYLLQASSRDEMQDWVRAIHEAAKEAAARRLTVFVQDARHRSGPNGDDDDDHQPLALPSPPAPVEPQAFGVELARLMVAGIPLFVERCLAEIETRGLEEVGVYRVPGSVAGINQLRALFDAGTWAVDLSTYSDINVVAGVLKQFLRELPEPLLTFQLYDGFIHAAAVDDYNERLWALKDLVHALPRPNYTLLKRLVEHLERVTDYEEINHMYSTNLAIVFGPTLLKPRPGPNSFGASMANLGHHQAIVKNLILQYHWIFDVEAEAEAIPAGEVDKSMEDNEAPEIVDLLTTEASVQSTESADPPGSPLPVRSESPTPTVAASLTAPPSLGIHRLPSGSADSLLTPPVSGVKTASDHETVDDHDEDASHTTDVSASVDGEPDTVPAADQTSSLITPRTSLSTVAPALAAPPTLTDNLDDLTETLSKWNLSADA
ncbi:hypothetical protein IWQ60_003133 [Tieghemiomyces parasiticus]|uniref:PH domain-containing protein n=1 Tax=Tieghemiomyces parasiticus TaxID=78921 RepID=A0A9W8ABE5_9FUNG|nr:hypothetical protein IWQ60_003133 [Tieghemiomyces parasiticus]